MIQTKPKILSKLQKPLCLLVLFLLFGIVHINAQSISATDGSLNCAICTPPGWTVFTGTPDVSDRNFAATGGIGGTSGGGTSWTEAPLPLPPNGHTNWLSLRDLGSVDNEEAVQTIMTGLIIGETYELTLYSLTAIAVYSPVYNDSFSYQVGNQTIQTINSITQNSWGTNTITFIASNTSETFRLFPGSNSAGNPNYESVQISITQDAIVQVDIDSDNDGVPDSTDICNGFDDNLDNDEDGIPDGCDEDDDNDGIRDALEENCGPSVQGFDAYWPMENSTADSSGNSFDLENGSVSFSSNSKRGEFNAVFDGNSDYLSYSDGTFLNQAISFFSYSLWVKPDNLNGIQTLLDEGGGTNGITIRLNGNILECAVRESGVQLNTSTFVFPNNDVWHHIALIYENGTVTLFLDGNPGVELETGYGELSNHTDSQNFGRSANSDAFGSTTSNYFEGEMDEIVHYPFALTPAQVNQLILSNCNDDTDTIVNSLDLDSDGDGCFDALEGDGSFTLSNIDTSGRLLGTVDNITGIPIIAGNGQGDVSSKNDQISAPICSSDTDGDGISTITEFLNGTNQNDPCDPVQNSGYTGFDGVNTIWRAADCDNDGILNGDEFDNGTDPYTASGDTDGDGIDDDTEIANGTDENDPCDPIQNAGYTGFDGANALWRAADCDDDGILNGDEFDNGTDPYSVSEDTDGDGIDDDTEIANGTNPNDPCDPVQNAGYTGFDGANALWRAADCDNDGVLNGDEFDNGTDPYAASGDTDGDGIGDDTETANGTNPNDPCDPVQNMGYGGYNEINDIWREADCDNDGVLNGDEHDNGTDPYSNPQDTDGDGISDDNEIASGFDQNNPCDPDQKSTYDAFNPNNEIWAAADCDGDGFLNGEEVEAGTNPYLFDDDLPNDEDFDGDGISDEQELLDGTDPEDSCDSIGGTPSPSDDCDNDGLTNSEESTGIDDELTEANPNGQTTDPENPDTDGDGIGDGQETINGTDPNDGCDSIGGTPPNPSLCDLGENEISIVSDLLTPDTGNGIFSINNIERFPNNSVKIFNRWGVKVFEATGYDNGNVSFRAISNARATIQKSEQLPTGVYYYIIEFESNNKRETITGYLYINR